MSELLFENQKILKVDLEKEMKNSFIDYAMSVIVARALPDVRDGLKPVHRRILYAMYEDNLTCDRPYRKAATTVGNVLGRYHPHGDASVYDAMVRMAQDFSLRYPLIDGHGNFGSVDGDPPAAYRYTEARMSKISQELMEDIEKDTVLWNPNFDDKLKEPSVIPSGFPQLLVNGSSGIAVGMATNIPPHNLCEVIDGACCLIDNPDAGLDLICQYIKGPDFPTGGIILGRAGIKSAYSTGKGKILVRAKTEIEEYKDGRFRIVVTELPYQVNKARLVENIADLHKEKRVDGITDIRDESDRNGMRVVIEMRKDINPQVLLNQLFKLTQLQESFSVNMLALVDNQPKILSLKECLSHYLNFRFEVIVNRTKYLLRKALDRAHILEGLAIACDNIDEIIRIIRSSYDNAKDRLIERFGISDIQAQAILEMQLRRLQGLEREKIENELTELHTKIEDYNDILAKPERVYSIIREGLMEIRRKYGDARRTEISHDQNDIDIEDLIDEKECVYTLTRLGYIKRLPTSTYRSQRRGGRGIMGVTTREEDVVETMFTASTHDHILFFTNKGRMYRLKGYQIPENSRTAKGMNMVNLLQIESDEKVTSMIPLVEFCEDKYVFFVTKAGTVKRISLSMLQSARKSGVRAIGLEDDDELVSVLVTDGSDKIIIATSGGSAIRFDENEVRPMGREAFGVRGIRLKNGDSVIGADKESAGEYLLTVTENGYGKLTLCNDYTEHHRASSGITAHNLTDKTGCLMSVRCVSVDHDLLVMTSEGVVIRIGIDTVRVCGRVSQGVILVRLGDGVKVIDVALTDKEESDEYDEDDEDQEIAEEPGDEDDNDTSGPNQDI
ncbi:MAG: DNA gyrase subunit A [Clostridiaceae bacterium]|nr:DNA gyrase subunit A [Clostridiaceae bacterium]